MATSIGTAWIQIKPTMKGISKEIEQELGGVTKSSTKAGGAAALLGKGMAALGTIGKGVALGGVAALSVAIGKNLGGAIKRVDTLVSFPKVLQSLGATSEQAGAATDKLSERLRGLPTSLSDGAAGVQRLVTAGLSVPRATDAFLGLNNALIASGAGTAQAESTMLQLSQALSRGKIDAQEWNSISANMPVLMGALQKSTGKTSNELREMFRNDPKALMDKIIELNENGGAGLETLEQTARNASGGISSAFSNMNNAIQRGMENIVRAIGGGDLEAGQKKISDTIGAVGKSIGDGLEKAGEAVASFVGYLKDNQGALEAFKGAVIGLTIATGVGLVFALKGAIGMLASAAAFAAPFIIVGAAIAAAIWLIKQNWDKLEPTVNTIKELFKSLWEMLKPIRDFIADQLSKAWDNLKDAFNRVWSVIQTLMPVFKIIAMVIGAVIVGAIVVLVAIIAVLIAAFSFVIHIIAQIISWIAQLVKWVVDAGAAIVKWFTDLPENATKAWNGIKNAFGNVANWFKDKFNQAKDGIIGVFNGIVNFVKDIPGKIVSGFKNIGGSIGESIKSAINRLLKLPLEIPTVTVGGKKIVGGQTLIPKLAEGGIVSSATLAIIGEGKEPEAVLPLSKLNAMLQDAGNASNTTENRDVHIENVVIASDYDASNLLNVLGIKQDLYRKGVV